MTDRIYNFSAGPAVLPEPVLENAQKALWNLDNSGIGIMEHSHRGPEFTKIIEETEAVCRELAGIPDHYKVLFLQGGASSQFYMVPMNLLSADDTADFINTGAWTKKAIVEAKRFGKVHIAGDSSDENFSYIPSPAQIQYSAQPTYVHFANNNTIFGTEWREEPTPPPGVPLVGDPSSNIFSRPIDVTKYGLIFAGAQKNLGPAGVTLVIIDEKLVQAGPENIPTMLQYRTHADAGSLYNTPPAFGIYILGEVLKWVRDFGGLAAMGAHNDAKAAIVYDFLDASDFYRATARPDSRSKMNVCFRAPSEALEAKFVAEAEQAGLSGLKGHRSVGGMRASIYNAFPKSGCERLVQFMDTFAHANG